MVHRPTRRLRDRPRPATRADGGNPLRFNDWNSEPSVQHEVNMTPLIDVALVLVVMLLIATPLAFESSIKVSSSAETAQSAETQDQNELIEIRVFADDRVRVNRTTIARADLENVLRPMLEASVRRQVSLSAEKGVTHGAFVGVMDVAKYCGATDIAVVESGRR